MLKSSDTSSTRRLGTVLAVMGAASMLLAVPVPSSAQDHAQFQTAELSAFANQPIPKAVALADIGKVKGVKTQAFGTPLGRQRVARAVDDRLTSMELVETVVGSALHALFNDESELRMGPASQVRLDRFVYNPNTTAGEMSIALGLGMFRFISGKMSKQGVVIGTRDVVIGIRGTDFTVDVDNAGTVVTVLEGEVEITPRTGGAGQASVTAGQTANISTRGVVAIAKAPPKPPAHELTKGGC